MFEYLNGTRYILNKCSKCGLIYQEEIPNDELMTILYEKWIDPTFVFQSHKKWDDLSYYSYLAAEVMSIIYLFKKPPRELLFLDFGMGWGRWLRIARAFGCNCYGMELSESRIKYAKSNGVKVISWHEISAHQFDFINTDQVFEHIPQPLETLFYLRRSLKPGGLLKISVPNGHNIKRRLRIMDWTAQKGSKNSLNAVHPLEHINCFNRTAIMKMTEIANLTTVKLPLFVQYAFSTNWMLFMPTIRNILRPIYRNLLQQGTYLFFAIKSGAACK